MPTILREFPFVLRMLQEAIDCCEAFVGRTAIQFVRSACELDHRTSPVEKGEPTRNRKECCVEHQHSARPRLIVRGAVDVQSEGKNGVKP